MSKDMNKSIHCFGASIVDVLMKPITEYPDPKVISNVFVDDMKFAPGGGATNCSLTLAKLDANVRLFSMVGSDHYGDYLKKEIKEAGVKINNSLIQSTNKATSSVLVGIHDNGERTFISYHGVLSELSLEKVQEEELLSSDILIYPDFFNIPQIDKLPILNLFKSAQKRGTITILDETWGILGLQKELFETTLPHVDFLMPSFDDLQKIYPGVGAQEMANHLISKGANHVILKLGAEGVLAHDGERSFRVPALTKAEDVIDCTGAGDNFNAGFVFALSKNQSLEKAVECGNEVAGLSIKKMGSSLEPNDLKKLTINSIT